MSPNKHRGGEFMIQACFVAKAPELYEVIESSYLPKCYWVKCEAISLTAEVYPRLGYQQDNDPKHSSWYTSE